MLTDNLSRCQTLRIVQAKCPLLLPLGGGVELDNCQGGPQTNFGSRSVTESKDGPADHQGRPEREEDDAVIPNGYKLVLITMLPFFCISFTSLDKTIMATAVPKITQQVHSLDDVGGMQVPTCSLHSA